MEPFQRYAQGEKMRQPVIAVYDKKTGLYDNPFVVRHNGEAIREFEIVSKDSNTRIGKNPSDFELHQIGSFDYTTGQLETLQPTTHLMTGTIQ